MSVCLATETELYLLMVSVRLSFHLWRFQHLDVCFPNIKDTQKFGRISQINGSSIRFDRYRSNLFAALIFYIWFIFCGSDLLVVGGIHFGNEKTIFHLELALKLAGSVANSKPGGSRDVPKNAEAISQGKQSKSANLESEKEETERETKMLSWNPADYYFPDNGCDATYLDHSTAHVHKAKTFNC